MKNRRCVLISLSFCLLVLISCATDEYLASIDQIYPIRTGNTWTYSRSWIQDGVIAASDTIQMMVGEKTTVDGNTGYSFDNHEIMGAPLRSALDDPYLVDNDKDGNYVTYGCYNDSVSFLYQSVLFKLHAKKDESWMYRGYVWVWYLDTILSSRTISCLSVDTVITVSGKSYPCMLFREKINDIEMEASVRYNYLSVNIGLVLRETYFAETQYRSGYTIKEELIEYQLTE